MRRFHRVLLPLLLIYHLTCADVGRASNDMGVNLTKIFQAKDPTPQTPLFVDGSPIFYNFDEEKRYYFGWMFMDVLAVAMAGAEHAYEVSDTYLRYFKQEESCRVQSLFNWLMGPDFRGPDAMRDTANPLRIVYEDPSLVDPSLPADDCSTRAEVLAGFNSDHKVLLVCPDFFHDPQVDLYHTQQWMAAGCDAMPDSLYGVMSVTGLTILHELLHWGSETMAVAGVEVDDYGKIRQDGSLWKVPGGPKHGYTPYNCFVLNQRDDVETSLNADSYAWMAIELWVRLWCPDKVMKDPVPYAPDDYAELEDDLLKASTDSDHADQDSARF